jgi:two-component system, NtrC family, sensor kinase
MPFGFQKKPTAVAGLDDGGLLDRPYFSFRLQISLGLGVLFFLALAVTIGVHFTIHEIEKRIARLQAGDRLLFHVEQARRWEKNYFLYGTNLPDALESTQRAVHIWDQYLHPIDGDIATDTRPRDTARRPLDRYHLELKRLSRRVAMGSADEALQAEIEINLRQYGAQMVEAAAANATLEYERVNGLLKLLKSAPAYFLVFLFLLMMFLIRFLVVRFMKPLQHLIHQTASIARGDLIPIKSSRQFQDEFSTLETAINYMLKELEQRQNSLIESHKLRAVGILTAGVAHELNNPLNNIMLTSYSLMEEYPDLDEAEQVAMIREIIGETDRARGIVRNLLDFTRDNKPVMEPLNLGRLVEETTNLAAKQAKMRGVPIHTSIEEDLPDIVGDWPQLKQVFLNLLLNALDAVGQEVKIEVRVINQKPDQIAVQVEDNGCGIPADALPHIFDPFFTTKPVGKGTGLGLAVSHGIIAKHGGRITATSVPGQNTVFTVFLPYGRPAGNTGEKNSALPAASPH